MNWDNLKDLGEVAIGAAAGMGVYIGALRARLNVMKDELRLIRKAIHRGRRRTIRLQRRVGSLPCQQKVGCRDNDQPPATPDRVLGGDR